jgi:hypothetical protein
LGRGRPPRWALRRTANVLTADRLAPPLAPAQAGHRKATPGCVGHVGAVDTRAECTQLAWPAPGSARQEEGHRRQGVRRPTEGLERSWEAGVEPHAETWTEDMGRAGPCFVCRELRWPYQVASPGNFWTYRQCRVAGPEKRERREAGAVRGWETRRQTGSETSEDDRGARLAPEAGSR